MNTKVLPKCENPLLFGDFLIKSFNLANESKLISIKELTLSIHALSSLFILITSHGLDYPNYYTYLYHLVTYLKEIFQLEEKHKFLWLLEISLKSSKVSSKIVASFMKWFLWTCIEKYMDSDNVVVYLLSLVCVLINKHPETKIMINQSLVENVD